MMYNVSLNYDGMNFSTATDTSYSANMNLFTFLNLAHILVMLYGYKGIQMKYFSLKYQEEGYCIVGDSVINCPSIVETNSNN